MKRFKFFSLVFVGALSVFTILSLPELMASPKQDRKTYHAALPVEGWEVVMKGLGKLTIEEAEQVKAALIQQLQPQINPPKMQAPVQKPDSTNKKKN